MPKTFSCKNSLLFLTMFFPNPIKTKKSKLNLGVIPNHKILLYKIPNHNAVQKIMRKLDESNSRNHNNKVKNILNGSLIMDNSVIVNHFNDYFTSVAKNFVENIPSCSTPFTKFLTTPSKNSIFLSPTTSQQIKNIISTFKPK